MGLKAKILQFFHGLRKKPSRPRKFKEGVDPQMFPKDPTGKRPAGFFMPEWAKKDSYETKDMGQMVPPEELAEEASLKAPGDWLKKQLTGKDDAKQFEELKQSKRSAQGESGMSDEEIEDFLGDFISQAQKRRRRRKKPRKP